MGGSAGQDPGGTEARVGPAMDGPTHFYARKINKNLICSPQKAIWGRKLASRNDHDIVFVVISQCDFAAPRLPIGTKLSIMPMFQKQSKNIIVQLTML